MRIFWGLIIFLIFVMGVLFALLNASDVTLDYYVGRATWPLAVIVIFAFSAGGILGLFFGWIRGRYHRSLRGKSDQPKSSL